MTNKIKKSYQRKIEPVEIQLSEKSSCLYIFFGGISTNIVFPPFEFYNYSKIMDDNKIFIRDLSQSWYQLGITGICTSINSAVDYIRINIEKINPQKIYFVGNSMGGYAAIMFCCLIGRGEVIAFSPQTFISPFLRLKHHDNRWKKQIRLTYRKSLFKKNIWNLKSLLLSRSATSQKISIFFSRSNSLDRIHALHLANIPGVQLFEFYRGGHELVRLLRDEGELPSIMSGKYSISYHNRKYVFKNGSAN